MFIHPRRVGLTFALPYRLGNRHARVRRTGNGCPRGLAINRQWLPKAASSSYLPSPALRLLYDRFLLCFLPLECGVLEDIMWSMLTRARYIGLNT